MVKKLIGKSAEKQDVTNGNRRATVWDDSKCQYTKTLIRDMVKTLTKKTWDFQCFWDRVPMLSPVLEDLAVEVFLKEMGIPDVNTAEIYSLACVPGNDGCLLVIKAGGDLILGIQQSYGAPVYNFYCDEMEHEMAGLHSAVKKQIRMKDREPSGLYLFLKKIGME